MNFDNSWSTKNKVCSSPVHLGVVVVVLHTNAIIDTHSTAQRHCPLTRRSELARALVVNT